MSSAWSHEDNAGLWRSWNGQYCTGRLSASQETQIVMIAAQALGFLQIFFRKVMWIYHGKQLFLDLWIICLHSFSKWRDEQDCVPLYDPRSPWQKSKGQVLCRPSARKALQCISESKNLVWKQRWHIHRSALQKLQQTKATLLPASIAYILASGKD